MPADAVLNRIQLLDHIDIFFEKEEHLNPYSTEQVRMRRIISSHGEGEADEDDKNAVLCNYISKCYK